jgi:tetratricopeptide (TPR) repeat protein
MTNSLCLALSVSMWVALPGCSGCDDASSGTASSSLARSASAAASAPLSAPGPVLRPERKTTSERIALANLDGQIAELERHVVGRPDDLSVRSELVSRLLLRARWLGRASDLLRATELGEQAPEAHAAAVEAWLLRARTRAAAHRFAEALADLDVAATKTRDPGLLRAQRGSVLAAIGRWDEALVLLEEERKLWPKPANLMMEAALRAQMGDLGTAQQLFMHAEMEHRDPSPIELVAILEARAAASEREGDLASATALYREASSRMPRHAHVAAHLAALLPPSEGIALLAPLADDQADPDLLATLGSLKELVEPGRGADDLARASRRFDELTAKLPQAYADHAAHFYLGAGENADKALRHALVNLEARKTPEAYELALRALEVSGMKPRACELAAEASALRYATPSLRERVRGLGCALAAPVASAPGSASPAASASASKTSSLSSAAPR